MDGHPSFGYWLRRRRKALDLTQEALAQQVGCSEITIRKIEADERRPSRQIAERLAGVLGIAAADRAAFLKAARAELSADRLAEPALLPALHSAEAENWDELSSVPVATATCPACYAVLPADQLFCGRCGAARAPAVSQRPQATHPAREERRWATILFADLAGFTSMSERMDPEDVKALLAGCLEAIGAQIQRYGGTILQIVGDGVLAVFGAPHAHEDDAERAVRAALALRESALGGASGAQLELHIGINTGEVLATMHGLADRREYTVIGDTVNTADRILKAAPAGSVLVGEETYRATRHAVAYQALPPVIAKGKARPVHVWKAISATPIPEARPSRTVPLVGRDDELAQLHAFWGRVTRHDQPHLALVLGEPGIGKSRLCAEFERSLPGDAVVLHGRCLPYGEVLGYGALALVFKEAAGITADDDTKTARIRLGDLVAGTLEPQGSQADPGEVARHLALLSGLDVEVDRSAPAADQRSLHMSVRQFLEALALRRPVCLIFEDIHWADGALLELIEFIASRVHGVPLMMIAQARWDLLEQRPAWGRSVRELVAVRLDPLDERRRHELLLELCRKHGLGEGLIDPVARQAGGNPLFMEELVAMIAEQGGVQAGATPSAIRPLLAARLDALPPEERSILQLAAVFGKAFWVGGVRALGVPGEIIAHVDRLEQKDFLQSKSRSQIRGDQEYTFKHELIRDVAYDMLPRAERRLLHGKVVDWMEQAFGERVEEYFDLLAYHAIQAGRQERAVDLLMRAAERAHRAAAYREEAALLGQAIAVAEQIGSRHACAELRARRGIALHRIGMWSDARSELEAAFEALGPDQDDRHIEALVELAMVCHWLLDVPSTRRYAAAALERAGQIGRSDLAAGAMGALAFADSSDGELEASLHGYQRAFSRAGQLRTGLLAPAAEMRGLILYWLGRPSAAIAGAREAVAIARDANDTHSTIRALGDLGLALSAGGCYEEALRVFDEAQQFGHEYGIRPMLARTIAMRGGLHLDVFDLAAAEALAEQAREIGRSANFSLPVVSGGIDLLFNFARRHEVARAEQLVGELADAVEAAAGAHGWLWKLRFAQARAELALAREAWEEAFRRAGDVVAQSRARGRVKYEVVGLGARGQALAAVGRTREALADLHRGVDLARPVGDPAMFLRAATRLLALDGDATLAAEAGVAAASMLAALPTTEMRQRLAESEPLQLLRRLGQ